LDPLFDVTGIETDEPPDLGERDPSLEDQTPDMAFRNAEHPCDLRRIEKRWQSMISVHNRNVLVLGMLFLEPRPSSGAALGAYGPAGGATGWTTTEAVGVGI
jgi:hypothetical protein